MSRLFSHYFSLLSHLFLSLTIAHILTSSRHFKIADEKDEPVLLSIFFHSCMWTFHPFSYTSFQILFSLDYFIENPLKLNLNYFHSTAKMRSTGLTKTASCSSTLAGPVSTTSSSSPRNPMSATPGELLMHLKM